MKCFVSGPLGNNTYLIQSAGQAVVVDPAPQSTALVQKELQKTGDTLIGIWVTHSHWDHVADAAALSQLFSVPVRVHRYDADNMISPGTDGLSSWIPIQAVPAPVLIQDGEELLVGDERFVVLHTPGHSLGSVCYYNAKKQILLTGDTLFRGTMGKVSFPTSDPKCMKESLEKLASLPHETQVYPGHGPSTTIGAERAWMLGLL